MIRYLKPWPALLVLTGLLAAGCRRENDTQGPPGGNAPAAVNPGKFLLASEPAGAKNVIEVRKQAKDGDEVVVVGRIGGHEKPWVEGRAAFWIVDSSFKPCNDRGDDACPTPWDYCCDDQDEVRKGMATVKFVNENGQTLPADARQLLKLTELQTVVVRGRAKRDGDGNLTVLAEGLYPRPEAGKKTKVQP